MTDKTDKTDKKDETIHGLFDKELSDVKETILERIDGLEGRLRRAVAFESHADGFARWLIRRKNTWAWFVGIFVVGFFAGAIVSAAIGQA